MSKMRVPCCLLRDTKRVDTMGLLGVAMPSSLEHPTPTPPHNHHKAMSDRNHGWSGDRCPECGTSITTLQREVGSLRGERDQLVSDLKNFQRDWHQSHAALKKAKVALESYRSWGEELNHIIGHEPDIDSWNQVKEALAAIKECGVE